MDNLILGQTVRVLCKDERCVLRDRGEAGDVCHFVPRTGVMSLIGKGSNYWREYKTFERCRQMARGV